MSTSKGQGRTPPPPKLAEIAARIAAHLRRFEASPVHNPWDNGKVNGTRLYYGATAWVMGARVAVRYVAYQGTEKIRREEALGYLAWLDAGGVGQHWEWERSLRPIITAEENHR